MIISHRVSSILFLIAAATWLIFPRDHRVDAQVYRPGKSTPTPTPPRRPAAKPAPKPNRSSTPHAANPTRTQSSILNAAAVFPAFQSAYGTLQSATIAPGRFRLVRHAGTRRLLEGELVLSTSAQGYQFYSAIMVAGSETDGDFGFLRYENSQWKFYWTVDSDNKIGITSVGEDIRTDGDTIAWYTKRTNFEEFVVWQRISGKHVTEKDLARTLSDMKAQLAQLESLLPERASKQNSQRLSAQLEQLAAVSNSPRPGTAAEQNAPRIASLTDFEIRSNITVNFRVNTAVLSDDAKATLDEIAQQAKKEKGYIIEITGCVSNEGADATTHMLSKRRAEAVIRYLAENHDIPLRRMINPFGFGELKSVAENDTREDRRQDRCVKVKILVMKL
jgi:outer membrane protein OmpA-like peptidoglycan-associated protein